MPDPRDSGHLLDPPYLDFDLEIASGRGRNYPITARSSAGEARETMRFPFDKLQLENRLQALEIVLLRSGGRRRGTLSHEEQQVKDFGSALFDALLTGSVRGRYESSLSRSKQYG